MSKNNKSNEDVPATDEGVGLSIDESVQVHHAGVGIVSSHQEQVLHGEGSGGEVRGDCNT